MGSVTEANTPIYYVYMISVIGSLSEHLTFIVGTKGPLAAPTPGLFWCSDFFLQMCIANIYVQCIYVFTITQTWLSGKTDTVECFFGKEFFSPCLLSTCRIGHHRLQE